MLHRPTRLEALQSFETTRQSATIYRLHAAPPVLPNQVVFRINGYEGRVILMDEIADRSIERHRIRGRGPGTRTGTSAVRRPSGSSAPS